MADAPASLGDFFAKKAKKKTKGSNLNNEASTTKVEEKKSKSKDKAEDEWEEEQIVETTMTQVSVAGRLTREDEESKEDGEDQRKAWGGAGKVKAAAASNLNEKKFPSLAKSVVGPSSNINIDDGSGGNINIKTSKNLFASLADENDDDEEGSKRPKHIKPAMVTKVKGEFASAAIQREVDKYSKNDKPEKSKKKAKKEDENEDDEEEDEEEEVAEEEENVKKPSKKEPKKKVKEADVEEEVKEVAEDVKIVPDEKASRAKYIGRAKLETKPLPKRELEDEKKAAPVTISKKKKKFMEEEPQEKKLLVADWD